MRWRRGNKDPEPTNESDARFEDDTDTWAESFDRPTASPAAVEDTGHDTWDDARDVVAAVDAEVVVPDLPERPEVPVDLGRVGEDDLARSLRRVVARSLAEDLGPAGDVTSIATVPPAATGSADIVAREDLVVAGMSAIAEVFRQLDPRVTVTTNASDGDEVLGGTVIATVVGPLRTILTGERTALNLVARLSGVATHTRQYSRLLDGTGVAVRDTRKTTPGLRLLEKSAVAAGGGANHRIGLHDALLVKDNHVVAAGSAREASRQALARAGGRHVQVEVTSLDQIEEVIEEGVVDILLDNFDLDGLRAAVAQVAGRAALEASGGVTFDTIAAVAGTGVDRIAVGALTHQAVWRDVALDVTDVDHRRFRTLASPALDPEPQPDDPAGDDAPSVEEEESVEEDSSPVDDHDDTSPDDDGSPVDDRDDQDDSSPFDDQDDTAPPVLGEPLFEERDDVETAGPTDTEPPSW